MSKKQFTDHFGNTIANFDKVLKFAKNQGQNPLTLKEQLELEKENQLEILLKKDKEVVEPDRFIQDCPYFHHEN